LRRRVYYRLVPPVKGTYRTGLWEELYSSLNAPQTPSLLSALFDVPPDYSFTFSDKGVIISAPQKYEEVLLHVLATKSEDNANFSYEKIGEDSPFQFGYTIIRWLKETSIDLTDDKVEDMLRRESISSPEETITSFQMEGKTQKDPAELFYTAAIDGKGMVQATWIPVWHTSLWTYFIYRQLKKRWKKVSGAMITRVRISKNTRGPNPIESGFTDNGMGFEWGIPYLSRIFLSFIWRKRGTKGAFGGWFAEKSFISTPLFMSRYFRLPMDVAGGVSFKRLEGGGIHEAATAIPWIEVPDEYVVESDWLCHTCREQLKKQEAKQKKRQSKNFKRMFFTKEQKDVPDVSYKAGTKKITESANENGIITEQDGDNNE